MMKLGFIYGRWGAQSHDGFDVNELMTDGLGLTGSENSFFNVAKTFTEFGCDVHVTCKLSKAPASDRPPQLHGAKIYPLREDSDVPNLPSDCDAYLSWNEPDILRAVPRSSLRIAIHQLNDFQYCLEGFEKYVDHYVFVSHAQKEHVLYREKRVPQISVENTSVIPNPIDLSLLPSTPPERNPHKIVYSSSPDRGLHNLLGFFPEIKKRVPKAELHVFYEWQKVYEKTKAANHEGGVRFRYMKKMIDRLGVNGEQGVYLHGNVSNRRMLQELSSAAVFAYPCQPFRFTEGFSVGTLDACAAGCAVVLSDADALPEIYRQHVIMIDGRPSMHKANWCDVIEDLLIDTKAQRRHGEKSAAFARQFQRTHIVDLRWMPLLTRLLTKKKKST